jgi:hypothetical protein
VVEVTVEAMPAAWRTVEKVRELVGGMLTRLLRARVMMGARGGERRTGGGLGLAGTSTASIW